MVVSSAAVSGSTLQASDRRIIWLDTYKRAPSTRRDNGVEVVEDQRQVSASESVGQQNQIVFSSFRNASFRFSSMALLSSSASHFMVLVFDTTEREKSRGKDKMTCIRTRTG